MLDINAFGREMMQISGSLTDDALCNAFARVGEMLTLIGQPRAPKKVSDMAKEDLEILAKAVSMLIKDKQIQ